MSIFNRMFGSKREDIATAAEPEDTDFIGALSRHIAGELEPALGAYQRIIDQNPDDNLAPFFAAAIQAGMGNTGGAAENLRALSLSIDRKGDNISRAVSLDIAALASEESHRLSLPSIAAVTVTFADLLKAEGFLQESAVCLEIATGLVPDRADVLHKFGDTLHDLGNYDYAESVLKAALGLAPFHWGALYTYAVLLQDLGRDAEAIDCYERAVRINPDHAKSRNNYGAALMRMNRLDEALAQCSHAAECDPDAPFVKLNLGNIHLLRDEPEKARDCFSQAAAHNSAEAYYGLASAERLLHGDSQKIRDLYLKAIALAPAVPEFHQTLGSYLAETGDQQALEHFSAAMRLNSDLPGLHKDFGSACLRFGRREEAQEHLKTALQQNPDDHEIQDLLHDTADVKAD